MFGHLKFEFSPKSFQMYIVLTGLSKEALVLSENCFHLSQTCRYGLKARITICLSSNFFFLFRCGRTEALVRTI